MDDKVRSLERYKAERDWFAFLHETVKMGAEPEDRLQEKLLTVLVGAKNRIVECAENDKPFVASYFCCAPEVYTAMDLPWFMLMETPFLAASVPYLLDDIDGSVKVGAGTDLCTAIRLPIYYIEAGLMPRPTAILGLLYPCDGAPMLHQVVSHHKDWRKIPQFACDPPYYHDQRSIDYFAEELKRMTAFITKHTGYKLDLDKLREAISESNKAYTLWQEYNELRRAVPSPHGWAVGGAHCFAMSQCFRAGDPVATEWFQQLVDIAEVRVREKKGAIAEEKIRLFWFDILPYGWVFELFPWLEEEWGAVIVMDMFANYNYSLIEPSTEDTMYRGLAKRNLLDAPMIRQARGVADNFVNDITRIVKDYKIDCVIWPGHMGHKDGAATVGIMRETCRDLDVPFLHIGLDLFDKRYTTVDEVKDKISKFFMAMGLG
ncbi:MAG: 2-hydroxyacyl-CoA dehydratase [Dehalococcoidia bacterium]|nr:2-hydroxyacyl-CoA dehydratase [Dehalococcoidia bacterium]